MLAVTIFRPFSYISFGIELNVIGDDDDLRVAALVGIEAQRAGAAGDDQADVAVLDAVGRPACR